MGTQMQAAIAPSMRGQLIRNTCMSLDKIESDTVCMQELSCVKLCNARTKHSRARLESGGAVVL